jgi:hypothetical protein
VDISNVANYFWSGNDQEEWGVFDDFPSLIPPWQSCFLEYLVPQHSVSKKLGTTDFDPTFKRAGVLVYVQHLTKQEIMRDTLCASAKEKLLHGGVAVNFASVLDMAGFGIVGPMQGSVIGVDTNGEPFGLYGERSVVIKNASPSAGCVQSLIFPAMLAISF